MKKILYSLALLLATIAAQAQYAGGQGQGCCILNYEVI
jgi:hypothetical protein